MSALATAGAPVLLAAAFVSLAAVARAQAPKGRAARPLSSWRLGLAADAAWYENAEFLGQPGTSWSTGGRASLDWSRRLQRGTLDLGVYGGSMYYPELESFRQAVYGGHLALSTTPSPRTQFTLDQSFARTNTRQLAYDTGDVPLPTTGLYTASASAGLTHRLSPGWEMALAGSFDLRRYDEATFVDGEAAGVGLKVARLVGRSGGVYASYDLASAWFDGTTLRAHQALLGARRRPKRGLEVDVSAGAAYVEPGGEVYPAGKVRLAASGRRAGFSLQYKRDFGQAFGYGRATVADLGSASLTWRPATRVSFDAGWSYGHRRDTQDSSYTIRSQVATGGMNLGSSKGLAFSARYSWERNGTEGFPRVEGGRVMASLSYGVELR
ncbi:MAG: TonB-dependent receptor [Vicinamibacteria bacterium]